MGNFNFSNVNFSLSNNYINNENFTLTKPCLDYCRDQLQYVFNDISNSGMTFVILAFIWLYINSAIIKHNKTIIKYTNAKEETLAKAIPILNDGAMIFLIGFVIYRLWFL